MKTLQHKNPYGYPDHFYLRSRPWFRRLTVLGWFSLVIFGVVSVAMGFWFASQSSKWHWLPQTEGQSDGDLAKPTWVSELRPQANGSFMASQIAVEMVVADVSPYYQASRDRSVDDYLAHRDEMIATYFVGPAQQAMQQYEATRTHYGVNRHGRYEVAVQGFSQDGLTAYVTVSMFDWVNDAYDVNSKALLATGLRQADIAIDMQVKFDEAAGRWKIERIGDAQVLVAQAS
jgi:hypothetical protein